MKNILINTLKFIVSFLLIGCLSYFAGVGVREQCRQHATGSQSPSALESPAPDDRLADWQLKEPSESAEFISGPLAANVGELCVFRLNDPTKRADWIIVPEATCYIDSSGSSLAFSSNKSAQYTVIAAIVEEGQPKILQHLCDYGATPDPSPHPDPSPPPTPQPVSLGEWIKQNIPDAGRSQCSALAFCYESTAEAVDKGAIKTQAAAYATLRAATQTKIKTEIWSGFLETLSIKLTDQLGGKTDANNLVPIFREIAEGLKNAEPEVSAPTILPFENVVCPDPTGKACQPQPQYRRAQ